MGAAEDLPQDHPPQRALFVPVGSEFTAYALGPGMHLPLFLLPHYGMERPVQAEVFSPAIKSRKMA